MSIVKIADYYRLAKDQMHIDNATSNELHNTKGPYLSSSLIGAGIGAGAGALISRKVWPTIGMGAIGALGGLAIAGAIHQDRALNRAIEKQPSVGKKLAILRQIESIKESDATQEAMLRGLYSGMGNRLFQG